MDEISNWLVAGAVFFLAAMLVNTWFKVFVAPQKVKITNTKVTPPIVKG